MPTPSTSALRAAGAVVLAAALAGCVGFPGGYGAPGGYGGYPGRDVGYPGGGYGQQVVVGTVQGFDRSSGRLSLSTDGGYGGYRGIEVRVDGNTRLYYQGRQHDVGGLEPGDQVRVDVQDDGRRLWARTIEVVRNVRDSGYGGYGGDPYGGYGGYGDSPYGGSGFEAAVRYVDTRRRVIEVTRGSYGGQVEQVAYDDRTRFDYRGQRVSPSQLEPGDIVRIDARRTSQGWYADAVQVTVNARSR